MHLDLMCIVSFFPPFGFPPTLRAVVDLTKGSLSLAVFSVECSVRRTVPQSSVRFRTRSQMLSVTQSYPL